ncbi:MAG: Regulator of RpoS [Phycisphaerae bacterium]|nr:Regulator of RpoS [Phycisphaerae bacterium]
MTPKAEPPCSETAPAMPAAMSAEPICPRPASPTLTFAAPPAAPPATTSATRLASTLATPPASTPASTLATMSATTFPPRPRVLVVDDDRNIVTALTARVRAAGCDPVTASNGREALQRLEAQKADAIILDVRMPVMDGLTLLGELRRDARWRGVPTIVLTASVVEKERALGLGARHFMEKPYDPAALMNALHECLTVNARGADPV